MRKVYWGVLAIAVTGLAVATCTTGGKMAEKSWGKYQVGDMRSGYTFSTVETRAMQDDDFANPAFLWVDEGETLWSKVDGEAGKSCADCHKDASKSMKGVAARYPVFNAKLGKMQNLEQRINQCRVENLKAKPYKYESKELLSMTMFVRMQSRGMPVNVKIDGPAAPFYEKGKAFYNQRRGQLDMACANCHMDYPGILIRANRLSQGRPNGFPLYRLKWQKPGSLHRRFRGCNKQVRAQPYGYGSDEYVNLELFLSGRDKGMLIETPAVRM